VESVEAGQVLRLWRFLREAAVMAVLAAVCAAVSNAAAGPERKLKWAGAYMEPTLRAAAAKAAPPAAALSASSAPAATWAPHPDKPWVEVSGADVEALFRRGDVPFLDARRTSAYRDGHIAGARPFSVWEADIDEKVKAFFEEGHDPSGVIVVYCSGGDCEDSHTLGQKLYMAGFDNVLVYKDGFPDWEKRGLPIMKGDKP
jgi:rhodanese-related sulfurtransferase